jgi:nucleoid DNA-binding protein
MNKRDLVAEISEKNQAKRGSTALIVDELLAAISRALSEGREVQLRRFGTFGVRARKARVMRNPRSGETIRVPAKLVPTFRSSKRMERTMNPEGSES